MMGDEREGKAGGAGGGGGGEGERRRRWWREYGRGASEPHGLWPIVLRSRQFQGRLRQTGSVGGGGGMVTREKRGREI